MIFSTLNAPSRASVPPLPISPPHQTDDSSRMMGSQVGGGMNPCRYFGTGSGIRIVILSTLSWPQYTNSICSTGQNSNVTFHDFLNRNGSSITYAIEDECVNLPVNWTNKVNSIATYGHCATIYSETNCTSIRHFREITTVPWTDLITTETQRARSRSANLIRKYNRESVQFSTLCYRGGDRRRRYWQTFHTRRSSASEVANVEHCL